MPSDAPPAPADQDYRAWVRAFDTLSPADRARIAERVASMPDHPVVSLAVAASGAVSRGTVASIRAQLYPRWELCLAGDGPAVAGALEGTLPGDPRVVVAPTPGCDGPCAAANAALAAASGEFVALVGAGDLLPEHALFEVAAELAAHPDAELLYTDEDRAGPEGRSAPRFKPLWSPELLLAHDAVGALAVYRRALVARLGGLRPEAAGAARWDLALRATAEVPPDRIRHIPSVLYHRRQRPPDAAADPAERRRRSEAGRRAVRDHLDAQGCAGARIEAAPLAPRRFRIVHPLPEPAPLVSVVVPTRDRAALLAEACAGVLDATDYHPVELLVVDNGSVEPDTLALLDRLARDARVRVLRSPGPFNYPRLNNEAVRAARGTVLALLNNDVEVLDPGWLGAMVRHALRPDVGIVGAKLLYPDGRVQHAGIVMGPGGAVQHAHRFAAADAPGHLGQLALARAMGAVTGACVVLRRAVYEEVGGLDEALAVAFNDVDLCLRLGDFGYRVVWTPDAVLTHRESATRGLDADDPLRRARAEAEWRLMARRWGRLLDDDPFHNPNLLLHAEPVSVPCPPRRPRPWRAHG